jgi:hypothetical protein
MLANRISGFMTEPEPSESFLPAGFAVCPMAQQAQSPLTIQLLAQQQAYEQAILAAREEAFRVVLSRLNPSLN